MIAVTDFLFNQMEYDRSNNFPLENEPNGIPITVKGKTVTTIIFFSM